MGGFLADVGTVSIIDTNKDEVIKTIDTGGKGTARIVVAPDIRYLAVSARRLRRRFWPYFQPITKEIAGKIKLDKGPISLAFAPGARLPATGSEYPANAWKFPPTSELYVAGPSGLTTVDLEKMAVASSKDVGQNGSLVLIHYTYRDGFMPPREGTSTRVMENDTYTLFNNAMFNYDVSGIHEHRTDMVAVVIGDGVAKIGCWYAECPASAVPITNGGLPYNNTMGRAGSYTGVPRGTLHIEEGASPSPRRMVIFMPKNNYYRQMNPKTQSEFQGKPGFTPMAANSRAWLWNLTLIPGKPVTFPKTDYSFVFLAGGLIRETRNNIPDIEHRLYGQWDTDSGEKTIEAISNRIQLVVIEFK